jgi:uncharacterized protein involved in high-affinity Fe2+ transport
MSERWVGWAIALGVIGGVGLVLLLNVDPGGGRATARSPEAAARDAAPQQSPAAPSGTFREYFIGDAEQREAEHLEIVPVWFPAVMLDGVQTPGGSHVVHLEADVRATANNPNGFALGEFIPYLKIRYEIQPAGGGTPLAGELIPMVARDGLHYGANVALPGPGRYRLTYHVEPPSAGGLGRHADPDTGVEPWWRPFDVRWDWDYQPPAPAGAAASDVGAQPPA